MKKIIILAMFFLYGCSSWSIPSLESNYLLLGRHKDVLISQKGIPTSTYKKGNAEAWEYYEGSHSYFDGYRSRYDWGGVSSTYHKKTIYFIEDDIIIGFKS